MNINVKTKKIYMLIGVPGSGKSTWIKNNFDNECVVISSDNFIEKMAAIEGKTYSQVFTKYVKAASKNIESDLIAAIVNDLDIIWDQTNLTQDNRKKKLDKIPVEYRKIAVYFDVPKNLDERLNSRPGKTIPKDVIDNMVKSLEKPSINEGFHEIIEVKN